jgi:hypothetical protein
MTFTIDYSTSRGLGRNYVDIPQAWIPSMLASEYAFTILYYPALTSVKSSVLIVYLSISQRKTFLYVSSYVALVIVNVIGFTLMFMISFQCHPPRAAYDLSIKNPSCIPILSILIASAALNIVTNVTIIFLPISTLTKMHLPHMQKIILTSLFMAGISVTAVNVVRLYYLQLAAKRTSTSGGGNVASSPDFSYNVSFALLWTAVEVNLGIICACIPTIKPLVKVLLLQKIPDHYHHRRRLLLPTSNSR